MATSLAARLKSVHGIDSYVDVIDPLLGRPIEDVGDHIRKQMSGCTQLLAVISYATMQSQWVPWEIGVATEKNFPLATYSSASSSIPEFLRKWPYLRSDADLDRYAAASKGAASSFRLHKAALNEEEARSRSTREFYQTLRKALGQD